MKLLIDKELKKIDHTVWLKMYMVYYGSRKRNEPNFSNPYYFIWFIQLLKLYIFVLKKYNFNK